MYTTNWLFYILTNVIHGMFLEIIDLIILLLVDYHMTVSKSVVFMFVQDKMENKINYNYKTHSTNPVTRT